MSACSHACARACALACVQCAHVCMRNARACGSCVLAHSRSHTQLAYLMRKDALPVDVVRDILRALLGCATDWLTKRWGPESTQV